MTYKELAQISNKSKQTKVGKKWNEHFTKENIQMDNKNKKDRLHH